MIFPKGQTIYENLNTSFIQLDAMLNELKSNQFTGYIHLTAWEYDGTLLLDTGNIVNAIEQIQDQRRHGIQAAEGIAAKGHEKDGAVSVYRLSPEMTQLLANLFFSEPIYKDLSSDLTGLDKLLGKLQSEKHTGYIEVNMPKSKSSASIFMRDGHILDSTLTTKDVVLSGSKALDDIILMTSDEHSLFTVYRADLAQAYGNEVNLGDSFEREGMLSLWQQVLQSVESTLDDKNSAFLNAFKRACISNAATYPFLDPFAAELEYKDGLINFTGRASVGQFNEGLSKTIAQTVRDLSAQPTNKQFIIRLRTTAAKLKVKYGGRLAEIGLTTNLPEVFGP